MSTMFTGAAGSHTGFSLHSRFRLLSVIPAEDEIIITTAATTAPPRYQRWATRRRYALCGVVRILYHYSWFTLTSLLLVLARDYIRALFDSSAAVLAGMDVIIN